MRKNTFINNICLCQKYDLNNLSLTYAWTVKGFHSED